MDMKKIITKILVLATAATITCSCNKFLDIVPDNVATIENAFSMRTSAEKFLATCYSYLPSYHTLILEKTGADEVTFTSYLASYYSFYHWYIARGYQNATSPYCNFWDGLMGGNDLYEAIRYCNIMIEKMPEVPDMETYEKNRWIAEAKFLKAFYHFYLTRMYGPIPIVDTNMDIDASVDEVQVYRNTLDECFDYIVNLVDEVIACEDLPEKIDDTTSELGRITKGIARYFKAEVLVYAASPLFNGNTDYTGYTDNRGIEIFCPKRTEEQKLERWSKAAQACKEAIECLEAQGYGLYHYTSSEYIISDVTRNLMTRRLAFNDREINMENVWYYTDSACSQQFYFNPGVCADMTPTWTKRNYHGFLSVPYETAALYYTKNGLPIEDDISWDYAGRFDKRIATDDDYLLIKPGKESIGVHFDRDPRFYSDLGFDGASWFGNGVTAEGSQYLAMKAGELQGSNWGTNTNITGYQPRKGVNYKTTNTSSAFTTNSFSFPIYSMRELYLYYAEALNESGADYTEVLPWINKIRERAQIPTVEVSWDNYSNSPGYYKDKSGLRNIIHRERTIELMFEGKRVWDQRRWKEAVESFNKTISGWSYNENTWDGYYTQLVLYTQTFETKDYFWPIKNSDLYTNTNLIQNPGW